MELRSTILRVLLWSLGLAAATGVLVVFTNSVTFLERMIATQVTVAIACGLILPCLTMLERERTRRAGTFGIVVVLFEFLLATAIIWNITRFIVGSRFESELFTTGVIVGLSSIIVVRLLPVTFDGAHIVTGWAGITSVAATSVTLLVGAWTSTRDASHWFETGLAVFTAGTLVSICLLGFERGPRRTWRWVGIVTAACALFIWSRGIWFSQGDKIGTVAFASLLAISATLSYWMICLHCQLKPKLQWFRKAMMISALATAALINLLVVVSQLRLYRFANSAFLEQCAAASGIVTACGTLALAVLARMQRSVNYERRANAFDEMILTCPRCQKKQAMSFPNGSCSRCSLRFFLRVEEPRCHECDYVLYGDVSDRCPECGTCVNAEATMKPTAPATTL